MRLALMLSWTLCSAAPVLLFTCVVPISANGEQLAGSSDGPAVTFQLNPAHTGATEQPLSALPRRRWSVSLPGPVSYPLIVHGTVYVTASENESELHRPEPHLYALDASNGKPRWGPVPLGGERWAAIAYDAGRVYALNGMGLLRAFDATTGTPSWSTQLTGASVFRSPPTAVEGSIYTAAGSFGGMVYAVDEDTGAVRWTHLTNDTPDGSAAVSSSGVWLAYGGGEAYDFAPSSGAVIWRRTTGLTGGGGPTPVLANDRLYVRDFVHGAVLDAETGEPREGLAAGPAPAVDSTQAYTLNGNVLNAQDLASGFMRWSFTGDGTLNTAPLVAAGIVVEGSSNGHLYGVSSETGKRLWTIRVGTPLSAPAEGEGVRPLTGLATSGGMLVVPAGSQLEMYR